MTALWFSGPFAADPRDDPVPLPAVELSPTEASMYPDWVRAHLPADIEGRRRILVDLLPGGSVELRYDADAQASWLASMWPTNAEHEDVLAGLQHFRGVGIHCVSNTCRERAMRHHHPPPLVAKVIPISLQGRDFWVAVLQSGSGRRTSRKRRLPWANVVWEIPAPLKCTRCPARGEVRPFAAYQHIGNGLTA